MKNRLLFIPTLLATLLLPTATQANMIIEYSEVGGSLFFEYSGSVNAYTAAGGSASLAAVGNQGAGSIFYSAASRYTSAGGFSSSTPYQTFWNVPYDTTGNIATGDTFMFRWNSTGIVNIWLTQAYSAGDSIIGSLTAGGYSIASSGIQDVVIDAGSAGTITIRSATASSVPDVGSTLALVGAAFICLLGAARLRRPVLT